MEHLGHILLWAMVAYILAGVYIQWVQQQDGIHPEDKLRIILSPEEFSKFEENPQSAKNVFFFIMFAIGVITGPLTVLWMWWDKR